MTRPRIVHYSYTLDCPLSCDFCFARERNSAELSLDKKLEVIAKLLDARVPVIKLTGGEPLQRKYFGDLEKMVQLADMHEFRPKISIHTTGITIDDEMLKFFERHRHMVRISLSIDGFDEEMNYRMRGYRPFFEKVMAVIPKLKERSIPCSAKTLVSRRNYSHLYDGCNKMADLIKQLGLFFWKFEEFVPANRGHLNRAEHELLPDQMQALKVRYVEALAGRGLEYNVDYRFILRSERKDFDYFLIQPDGSVFTADSEGNEPFVGNIFGKRFDRLWGRIERLNNARRC